MKQYKPLFDERRMYDYKAYYNPSSDYWYQFSINGIHNEIAQQELHLQNANEAIKKGYAQIYLYNNELNIRTFNRPDNREFLSTKDMLEKNSYFAKVKKTNWEVIKDFGYYVFNNFFFTDTIEDGKFQRGINETI
jgi:hypothetical protein